MGNGALNEICQAQAGGHTMPCQHRLGVRGLPGAWGLQAACLFLPGKGAVLGGAARSRQAMQQAYGRQWWGLGQC